MPEIELVSSNKFIISRYPNRRFNCNFSKTGRGLIGLQDVISSSFLPSLDIKIIWDLHQQSENNIKQVGNMLIAFFGSFM